LLEGSPFNLKVAPTLAKLTFDLSFSLLFTPSILFLQMPWDTMFISLET